MMWKLTFPEACCFVPAIRNIRLEGERIYFTVHAAEEGYLFFPVFVRGGVSRGNRLMVYLVFKQVNLSNYEPIRAVVDLRKLSSVGIRQGFLRQFPLLGQQEKENLLVEFIWRRIVPAEAIMVHWPPALIRDLAAWAKQIQAQATREGTNSSRKWRATENLFYYIVSANDEKKLNEVPISDVAFAIEYPKVGKISTTFTVNLVSEKPGIFGSWEQRMQTTITEAIDDDPEIIPSILKDTEADEQEVTVRWYLTYKKHLAKQVVTLRVHMWAIQYLDLASMYLAALRTAPFPWEGQYSDEKDKAKWIPKQLIPKREHYLVEALQWCLVPGQFLKVLKWQNEFLQQLHRVLRVKSVFGFTAS